MSRVRDRWAGLQPGRPPAELRARVLSAARDATLNAPPTLLEALYRDRVLRLCAAGLAALVVAHALLATGGGATPAGAPESNVFATNDAAAPGDQGLTAVEQFDALAPVLAVHRNGSPG